MVTLSLSLSLSVPTCSLARSEVYITRSLCTFLTILKVKVDIWTKSENME